MMARRLNVAQIEPGAGSVPRLRGVPDVGGFEEDIIRGRSIGVRYRNNLEQVQILDKGLPAAVIETFCQFTGLSVNRINNAAKISTGTYSRRKRQGRFSSEESERLLRISRVFELAVELHHGDRAAAQQWLETPLPVLGDRRPLDLAGTEPGGREVEDLIGRIQHGIVS
jgi:putative toxin-antitoxin system antitoxin component (TIGR02293 family)